MRGSSRWMSVSARRFACPHCFCRCFRYQAVAAIAMMIVEPCRHRFAVPCLQMDLPYPSVQCAAAVDNLAGYYFKHMPGSESPTPAAAVSGRLQQLSHPLLPPTRHHEFPQLVPDCPAAAVARRCRQLAHRIARCHCPPQAIGEHLRQRPELLPQILSTLFEIVLFEDCTNQWSLSRPMLRWRGAFHSVVAVLPRWAVPRWAVALAALGQLPGLASPCWNSC
jgi:hypothetical protein